MKNHYDVIYLTSKYQGKRPAFGLCRFLYGGTMPNANFNEISDQICNKLNDVVKSIVYQYLENCILIDHGTQNACHLTEEDLSMASKHRMRIVIAHDENGEPICKQICAKTELELADAIVMAYIKSGRIREFLPNLASPTAVSLPENKLPEPEKHPIDHYARYWLCTFKNGGETRSKEWREHKVKSLLKYFGSMNIEDITVAIIQQFLDKRAFEDKMSYATVKGEKQVLLEMLSCAYHDGLITNDFKTDRRLKNNAEHGDGTIPLTGEQYREIRASIPMLTLDVEKLIMILLAYTSFRREEIIGLKWECVDFEHDEIRVEQVITFNKDDRPIIKAPKTKQSERRFPMSATLKQLLTPFRKASGYVISPTGDGSHIGLSTWRTMWRKSGEQINLYGATPKVFRTTFVTLGITAGIDPKTMQGLCGHSNTATTMNIYAKVVNEQLPKGIEQLDRFIG